MIWYIVSLGWVMIAVGVCYGWHRAMKELKPTQWDVPSSAPSVALATDFPARAYVDDDEEYRGAGGTKFSGVTVTSSCAYMGVVDMPFGGSVLLHGEPMHDEPDDQLTLPFGGDFDWASLKRSGLPGLTA